MRRDCWVVELVPRQQNAGPEFEKIPLRFRKVILIPDNDFASLVYGKRKNTFQGLHEFGTALRNKWAQVKYIELPPGFENKGLDDYLLNYSVDELLALSHKDTKTDKEIQEEQIREILLSGEYPQVLKTLANILTRASGTNG